MRIDEVGSIWIGYKGEEYTGVPHELETVEEQKRMTGFNAAMPVSSLVHILSDRFDTDITNKLVWIELEEE